MVHERASADSDILAFSKTSILDVVDKSMPDLATAIDDSHFTLVLINLEQLNYFCLHIEIVKFVAFFFLWGAILRHIF